MPFTISSLHLKLMLHGVHVQAAGIQISAGPPDPLTSLGQKNLGHLQKNFMSKLIIAGITAKHHKGFISINSYILLKQFGIHKADLRIINFSCSGAVLRSFPVLSINIFPFMNGTVSLYRKKFTVWTEVISTYTYRKIK